jgi:hypothetical protein
VSLEELEEEEDALEELSFGSPSPGPGELEEEEFDFPVPTKAPEAPAPSPRAAWKPSLGRKSVRPRPR